MKEVSRHGVYNASAKWPRHIYQISISFQVRGEVGLVPSYVSAGSELTAKQLLPAPEQTRFENQTLAFQAVNFCMNQCPAPCPCTLQNREQTQKPWWEALRLVFAKQSQSPCLKMIMGPVEDQELGLQIATSKPHSRPGTE